MKKIVFIVGQGGSGKTTLVNYFRNHPVNDWVFFDFDNGAIKKPDSKDSVKLKKWAEKQREHWIEDLKSEKYQNQNIVLFGINLFPWKVGSSKNIHFAYLVCGQESRKDRLEKRGDRHLWDQHHKDVSDIVCKLNEYGAKPLETGSCSVEESAQNIKNWLLSLENKN